MENFNEQLNFTLKNRPRKKFQIMKALTFHFQELSKIAFKANEISCSTKRFLNLLVDMGYVQQYTKIVNYKLYRSYRWTQEGFKAYQILEQKHREQSKAMHKNHEAYEKTCTFVTKYPTLTDTKTPLVNVGVEK